MFWSRAGIGVVGRGGGVVMSRANSALSSAPGNLRIIHTKGLDYGTLVGDI